MAAEISSDSVNNKETEFCLLVDQKTGLFSKKNTLPPFDQHVAKSDA